MILQFFTGLSFLFAFTITVLLVYGYIYYRQFAKGVLYRKQFPIVFILIALACLGFLWINMHAPLRLKTVSNLDHHFIRHDGFAVRKQLEMGGSDTIGYPSKPFNQYVFSREQQKIILRSGYSEEPLYTSQTGVYKIRSAIFPAPGHALSFTCDSVLATVRVENDMAILSLGGQQFSSNLVIRKGLSLWNIFGTNEAFVNSSFYRMESLATTLHQVVLLRDDVSKQTYGSLGYFISGRIFQSVLSLMYDNRLLTPASLAFETTIPDGTTIAWGVGFLDNNKNQFRIREGTNDSFYVYHKFPVAYPLTEEEKDNWEPHTVSKFLVGGSKDLLGLSPVFKEGFMFSSPGFAQKNGFSPIILSYQKSAVNKPILLSIITVGARTAQQAGDQFALTALSGDYRWLFSIQNTMNWQYTRGTLQWPYWLFGSLLFFIVMILLVAWTTPAYALSWVWQILSCIALVLLTTRFFMYWRYKSFPPYEGMDMPSVQQLNSRWNFDTIILATIILAISFGMPVIKRLITAMYNRFSAHKRKITGISIQKWQERMGRWPVIRSMSAQMLFFIMWLLILTGAGVAAWLSGFESGICRHLCIGLVLCYFLFVFLSYKYSPLVSGSQESWWKIATGSKKSILINNPVKILLSVSLLAVFGFIDIGFSIVFINFLLFNEAFLCSNYAMAGLSAGSKANARLFGWMGALYFVLFLLNLLYAPYIFNFLLGLPQSAFLGGYVLFSLLLAGCLVRLWMPFRKSRQWITVFGITVVLSGLAFLFFPREKVISKAGMTRYRIDVQIKPTEEAILQAYEDGKTYEPVIRAAQNQWFINTFIHEDNNPGVSLPVFRLLPHAPQNKGARYNAQATDLVASRFFIAEHGQWSVLLYIVLLLLPVGMLASFYKLYPDFTNRINNRYPAIVAGFSVLNYLMITALLVVLAATGRYIFFGQDLPFGSILSKQSVIVPVLLIIASTWLFGKMPQEYYANRKKMIPGMLVFAGLLVLLLFVKPLFNTKKEFGVAGLAREMDTFVEQQLQPVWDYIDTAKQTRRYSIVEKDRLFSDSIGKMVNGASAKPASFFLREMANYSRTGFSQHIDGNRLLFLDMNGGYPKLAVNPNYFRIDPPPHLQQSWTADVYGDSSIYNVFAWQGGSTPLVQERFSVFDPSTQVRVDSGLLVALRPSRENRRMSLFLINRSGKAKRAQVADRSYTLPGNDSIILASPSRVRLQEDGQPDTWIVVEPDVFMRNYFVNGARMYAYPMGNKFTWARNFAESISGDRNSDTLASRPVFISVDREIMDSLSQKLQTVIGGDTAYKKGAEYGICIADGNGRLLAMADFIKGLDRPDPNDKALFNAVLRGENGIVSQALLRKQIGNVNLLRLNPGPGSTLKPIVFASIASQLNINWDAFSSEGFSVPTHYFGGEKVAEYDFEKNNGRISSVMDYLKYSDNYYHSNVLLLGSYPRQSLQQLLNTSFSRSNSNPLPAWPNFNYNGSTYFLQGFRQWPGYRDGAADFYNDSSFLSIGMLRNFGIYTKTAQKSYELFNSAYDSLLFGNGATRSGFILPEYGLFDQEAAQTNHRIPYDIFARGFRGHVKGSSQVLIPPLKMLEAFGKLVSQNSAYALTLDPGAMGKKFASFYIDSSVKYNHYQALMRESVFEGMKQALFNGTAAKLGSMLKNGSPWYYYAKTGTTGDNDAKTKSKLLVLVISKKDISSPGFNFRNNRFYTIYFTSQNGPALQNEQLQADIIRMVERSPAFQQYMKGNDQ